MRVKILLILMVLVFFIPTLNESALAAEDAGHEHDHNSSFSLFSLVKPLGVTTLCCVFATFLAGLFRRKLGRRFLRIHVPLAIISVILGFTHGTLVFILYR